MVISKSKLALVALILGAVAVVNGCTSTYGDGVKRRVSRMYNFHTNANQLTLKCNKGDEEACLTYAKFADVFNQCKNWNSGIACAEYGKINYYGDGKLIKPDLDEALYNLDYGCNLKTNNQESCDLAKQIRTKTMPEDPNEVLKGIEVSTPDTQARAFAAYSIQGVVRTCPGAPNQTDAERAANLKSFVRKHYPQLRDRFPEYWWDGMAPRQGRNVGWYMMVPNKLAERPGSEARYFSF